MKQMFIALICLLQMACGQSCGTSDLELRLEGDWAYQLSEQEQIRQTAMYPKCFDVKTAQLILVGILLAHLAPAAEFHARAAKRAGATKEELHAVAGLTFLFRGLPAFNLASEIINKIFDEEAA